MLLSSLTLPLINLLFAINFSFSPLEARLHYRRQIHKLAFSQNQCEEPPDLKTRLSLWDIDSSGVEKDRQEQENDWRIPDNIPSETASICEKTPATGVDSSEMQRSLCPWQLRLNHDDEREPKLISEAICLCRKSRGSSGSYCMPIKRDLVILKRVACNPITRKYEYIKTVQSITVGCHSVLPRTQRALPLSAFYDRVSSIEV